MKWLDDESVKAIQEGTYDISQHFEDADALSMFPESCNFDKPEGWDDAMEDVKTLLNVPNY